MPLRHLYNDGREYTHRRSLAARIRRHAKRIAKFRAMRGIRNDDGQDVFDLLGNTRR